jgi:hypothetical protein
LEVVEMRLSMLNITLLLFDLFLFGIATGIALVQSTN